MYRPTVTVQNFPEIKLNKTMVNDMVNIRTIDNRISN